MESVLTVGMGPRCGINSHNTDSCSSTMSPKHAVAGANNGVLAHPNTARGQQGMVPRNQ